MNASIPSLLALVLTFSAALATAQSYDIYAPRGENNLDNDGPRIVLEAQSLKGDGARTPEDGNNPNPYSTSGSQTYHLQATVLIHGASIVGYTYRTVYAKGRSKKEAMSDLRNQVNAIGANAQVVRIRFIH